MLKGAVSEVGAEDYRQQLKDLLCALVSIPTENVPPRGFEAEGQRFFKAYCLGMGLEVDEFSPADLPEYPGHPEFLPRDFTGRNNIVAVWKGTGGGRSLLLTGHMDVAPKEPLPWSVTEPFVPLMRDGRLYGRGAADMKGGLCCAAVAVKALKESGYRPKGDILLESVVDEEYAGVNGTLACRLKGYGADFGIVLEPSGLTVCPACLGGLIFVVSAKGTAGLPYTGEEIRNPAYDIAALVRLMPEFEKQRAARHPRPPLWRDSPQELQVIVTKMKAGEATESGQLSLPIDAWAEIVVQTYPGERARDAEAELAAFISQRAPDPEKIGLKLKYHYCRPGSTDPAHPAVGMLAARAARHTDLAKVCGALFSCDLFALTEVGRMPAVIFGPCGGRLHAPDEWVDLGSLDACMDTLTDFIPQWCG